MASYFGHRVHPSTRCAVIGECAGTTKSEGDKDNTLGSKQHRLLSGCVSVIICYDNFQRGVAMQDQRGKHSSSFFKGTHQCAHKVKPFVDQSFDSHYVPLTYMNQEISSPWGMTVFEQWDEQDPSVKFPDFTGQRVKSFEGWKYCSRILGHLRNAFPVTANPADEASWSDY